MDWTEIITAVIAAVAAVGGSALVQSKATAVLQAKFEALKEEDIATLSGRVDKHNQLQERVLKNECKIEELEKEIRG
ncbi:MAG: hypothetical protein LUF89_03740 [Ruminococcus sp.]|nr:hypothetical protein [Ruminococcus sp.]